MPLSKDQLERRRSPAELQAFAEEVRSQVRPGSEEYPLGMNRIDLYKEFLDETLPLSQYAVQAYPGTYAVEHVLGPQPYDAIVYNESGTEVERLELTRPHDGAEAAANNRLVQRRHFGRITVDKPGAD